MQNHQITRIHHETISRPKKTSSGESPLLKLFIYITLPLLNPFILHWLLKHNFTPWILKHVHLNSTIHLKTHDYPYLNLRSNTFWHENTHLSWPKTLMTHLNPPWDFPPKTAPTVADRCRPLPGRNPRRSRAARPWWPCALPRPPARWRCGPRSPERPGVSYGKTMEKPWKIMEKPWGFGKTHGKCWRLHVL